VPSGRWTSLLCAALLLTLVSDAAHATLIGQNVSVTLTDGGALDAAGAVLVGAGAEVAPGDGSSIGALMLPNESIDLGAFTIEIVLEEGAADGTTGYPAGTHYLFSDLSFSDPSLFISGVSLARVNVTGVALGSEVGFGSDFVSLLVDTLVIGDIPGVDVGKLTLTLEVSVPEPAALALLAGACAACAVRRRLGPARA
jgi:hypothetical protein